MRTKKYMFAKSYASTNYLIIVIFLVMGLGFMIQSMMARGGSLLLDVMPPFLMGAGFLARGIYSISILPRMKEIVYVSEQQITQERPDGTSTTISWNENFETRRNFLGRLELVSQDGQRIIKLERQLDGYPELVEFISHCKQKHSGSPPSGTEWDEIPVAERSGMKSP
ncbi:MAG: hypothetical protein WA821_00350 [Anaerolineales bacterium]